jgi:IclR family acetate operon transcriptional repressor
MPKKTPVKAVQTALKIVEGLVELDGAGVNELAKYLNIPNSTVHDHLRTLKAERYVLKKRDEYYISTRFLELGERSRKRMDIYQAAEDEVEQLARGTGEHVLLMGEEDGLGVILAIAEGEEAVNIDSHAGLHIRLHTTAMGKCILAQLPAERANEIIEHYGLPKRTKTTITDPKQLKEELVEIRKCGYSIDQGGEIEGVRCIATPILQHDEVVGSIGLCGPQNRIQGEFAEQMREKLLQTANVIEVTLNYS